MQYDYKTADEAMAHIDKLALEIVHRIRLTPVEEIHVKAAAKLLVHTCWKYLEDLPETDRVQMRAIVTTVAIASSLGVIDADEPKSVD